MINSKIKDLKNRKFFEKKEKFSYILKFLRCYFLSFKKLKFSNSIVHNINKKKNMFSRKTKIVNRCSFTNRGRGNFRKFSASRLIILKLMRFGFFPGYKKAVW